MLCNCLLFDQTDLSIWPFDYLIYSWDKQPWTNSVDPDQMPQNVASDQGLHFLPLIQQFLDASVSSQMNLLKV